MRRHQNRTQALALVPLFVLAIVLLSPPASRSVAVNGFSPNQELPLPALAPIGGPGGPVAFIVRGLEPSLRVGPDGTVYVASIRGVPGGVDLHRYYAPTDGTVTAGTPYPFKYEGQPDGCGIFAFGCNLLGIAEGGGDVDIAVNYGSTPNLALTSLTLAPGITATHSTDRGDTFSQPNPVAAFIPVDDRMWNDGIDALTVYMSYHDVTTFNIEVQRSNDGGSTYLNGLGEAIDPQTFPVAGGVPATNTGNIAGSIRVDRSRCPSRGNLYQIFVAPETVAENLSGQIKFRSVYVGVSTDVKLGLPVFTFTDHKIFTGPAGSTNGNIFPALSVDRFGNLYALWSDNSNILYSFSTDLGTTWAPAIRVNGADTVGRANVFPWMDADENGHVGIVWFGADRIGDSNDRAVMEPGHPASQGAACNDSTTTCMSKWASWNVYFAESFNAHDAAPAFTQSVISDHVVHRGTISTGGLGGGADRSLADYFQIAFDPQHRANVAFSDDHLVNTEVGPNNGPDNPTTRRKIRANFTYQVASPSPQPVGPLATTGFCAVGPGEPGPMMTGGGRLGSSVNFGFIAKANPLNGALEYQAQNLNVHSSGGITSVTFSGSCANFDGNAKVNDSPGYTFRASACDVAEPGVGKDTFSIDVSGPNSFAYHNGGKITEGNIQAH